MLSYATSSNPYLLVQNPTSFSQASSPTSPCQFYSSLPTPPLPLSAPNSYYPSMSISLPIISAGLSIAPSNAFSNESPYNRMSLASGSLPLISHPIPGIVPTVITPALNLVNPLPTEAACLPSTSAYQMPLEQPISILPSRDILPSSKHYFFRDVIVGKTIPPMRGHNKIIEIATIK